MAHRPCAHPMQTRLPIRRRGMCCLQAACSRRYLFRSLAKKYGSPPRSDQDGCSFFPRTLNFLRTAASRMNPSSSLKFANALSKQGIPASPAAKRNWRRTWCAAALSPCRIPRGSNKSASPSCRPTTRSSAEAIDAASRSPRADSIVARMPIGFLRLSFFSSAASASRPHR